MYALGKQILSTGIMVISRKAEKKGEELAQTNDNTLTHSYTYTSYIYNFIIIN